MIIRKTKAEDLQQIAEIYKSAKQYMRENGNPMQWSGDYPAEADARADMQKGIGYVCEDEGEIVAVFAFNIAIEPTYNKIYDGAWLKDGEYAFIHRIAVKKHGKGIVDFCFKECFAKHQNLRIDTHRDNIPMQKVLLRNGFKMCGRIYLENGDERLAFQKI